ncbi:MAG TPA: hypothetical protein VNX25_05570 [Verrucomicrobiae bacterium]|nr:hypothetical protein [Verrucomicrobiae bacterium]
MDLLFLPLFVVNILLGLADASVAWHRTPAFVTMLTGSPGDKAVADVRSLLPLLVALYTSLNCYAYHHREILYLAGVSILLCADIATQLYVSRRSVRA